MLDSIDDLTEEQKEELLKALTKEKEDKESKPKNI